MPLVLLIDVQGSAALKGGKRKLARLQKQALLRTAEYWHRRLFPRHFTPGNTSRYQLQPRTRFYKEIIKKFQGQGQGRFVDLVLTGRSARAMKSLARFTSTTNRTTVRMRPPSYFTNPFATGGKQQPDKVAEVQRMSAEDRSDLQDFFRRRVAALAKDFHK